MVHLDPVDDSHDLVCDGINDVYIVPGAVGLDDTSDFIGRGPQGDRTENDSSRKRETQAKELFVSSSLFTPRRTM